ncbi:hypothetical protein L9G74_21735, partial [Shewanella sp. C32]
MVSNLVPGVGASPDKMLQAPPAADQSESIRASAPISARSAARMRQAVFEYIEVDYNRTISSCDTWA